MDRPSEYLPPARRYSERVSFSVLRSDATRRISSTKDCSLTRCSSAGTSPALRKALFQVPKRLTNDLTKSPSSSRLARMLFPIRVTSRRSARSFFVSAPSVLVAQVESLPFRKVRRLQSTTTDQRHDADHHRLLERSLIATENGSLEMCKRSANMAGRSPRIGRQSIGQIAVKAGVSARPEKRDWSKYAP